MAFRVGGVVWSLQIFRSLTKEGDPGEKIKGFVISTESPRMDDNTSRISRSRSNEVQEFMGGLRFVGLALPAAERK